MVVSLNMEHLTGQVQAQLPDAHQVRGELHPSHQPRDTQQNGVSKAHVVSISSTWQTVVCLKCCQISACAV